MTKLCILILLSIGACTIPSIPVPEKYRKKPNPEASPEPTVSPAPQPTEPPQVARLIAPVSVSSGQRFNVSLCGVGYEYEVQLYADEKYLLGTFGFDRASGCSVVFGIVLNQKGVRTLSVKNSEAAPNLWTVITVE